MDFYSEVLKRKDEIISKTQDILRINSVLDLSTKTDEKPFGEGIYQCLCHILNEAEKDGFITKNVNNYAGHIEYGEGKELFGILCHLDVVPASGEWLFPPFSATISDNKIYARGAIDDKGAVMATYFAFKILKEMNIKLNRRFRLILGLDEETGVLGIEKYFLHEEMPEIGYSPDADFPVIHGEKGSQRFFISGKTKKSLIKSFVSGLRLNMVPDVASVTLDVDLSKEFNQYLSDNKLEGSVSSNTYTIHGLSSHAMHPFKGINAIYLFVDFLKQYVDDELIDYLDKYITHSHYGEKYGINHTTKEMGDLTMNLGILDYKNNEFKLGIDIRYPSNSDSQNIREKVMQSIPNNFQVNFSPDSPVSYVDPESELVKTLMASYQKYTNDYETKPYTIGGGTYARTLKQGVAFGPLFVGRPDVVHQTNEYIEIDDLLKSIVIYMDAIYRLGTNHEN